MHRARLPAGAGLVRCRPLSSRAPPACDHAHQKPDPEGPPMDDHALISCIAGIRSTWGPLSSDVVARSRAHLEELARAPASEPWLAALHQEAPATRELHRDPLHGFVLLAHSEPTGLYRPPHDHGRSWVIYVLQRGELEMGSYARVQGADGQVRLVRRDATLVRPGQALVYLPGDIHDTRCLAGPALLF